MTARQLEATMPARELDEWAIRSTIKPLWPRRLEMMLSQVCLWIARTHGSDVQLHDLDFFADRTIQRRDSTVRAQDNAQMIAGIAGGVGVRVLGQGRRKPREVH